MGALARFRCLKTSNHRPRHTDFALREVGMRLYPEIKMSKPKKNRNKSTEKNKDGDDQIENMTSMVKDTPLLALVICRGDEIEFNIKIRERNMISLIVIYMATLHFEKDYDLWREFCRQCETTKGYKKAPQPERDAPRKIEFVTQFVYGRTHDYDRGHKIARVLELYQAEGLAPKRLRERIDSDGGMEAAYKKACQAVPKKGKTASQIASDVAAYGEMVRSGRLAIDCLDHDAEDQRTDDMSRTSHKSNTLKLARLVKLEVMVTANELDQLKTLPERSSATIKVQRTDRVHGWDTIVSRGVECKPCFDWMD